MSFLKKIFGGKPPPAKSDASAGQTAQQSPKEKMIKAYDSYGREILMTRQNWIDSVLEGAIKKAWNNPDELASVITQSFYDEIFEPIRDAVIRLHQVDNNHERGAVLLAVFHLQLKETRPAERVLDEHIKKHGTCALVLLNLAKVYSQQGHDKRSLETLWRSLELDPNHENAVGWYEVFHREQGGQAASLEALRRMAALPKSWRPQLWLARAALAKRNYDDAKKLYDEALANAPRPVPTDLLMQMSGDLGNAACLLEILQWVAPHFDAALHGMQVGNNLIKACVDLGMLDEARAYLDKLAALKRFDWQEGIAYWDKEIAKNRIAIHSTMAKRVELSANMAMVAGPIWLRDEEKLASLFEPKAKDAPVIAIHGSSVKYPPQEISDEPQIQMSNLLGRHSRSIPLFLAEQIHLRTEAVGEILQPYTVVPSRSFVVCGAPTAHADVAHYARQGEPTSDYAVNIFMDASHKPWIVNLAFIRTIDEKTLAEKAARLDPEHPEQGYQKLAALALECAHNHAQISSVIPPMGYLLPTGAHFTDYLLRLEQALATIIASHPEKDVNFLSGEREIVLGNIQLCLDNPQNPVPRLLLATALRYLKKVHPAVVVEYRDRVQLLQQENPLPANFHEPIGRLLDEIFAT